MTKSPRQLGGDLPQRVAAGLGIAPSLPIAGRSNACKSKIPALYLMPAPAGAG